MTDSAVVVMDGFDLAAELRGMPRDAAEAFQVWLIMPERNAAELGRQLGHEADTVRHWVSRYRWRDATARYDAAQGASLLSALRSAIVRHSFEAVKIGVSIMGDGAVKPADRLKAAMWIASLGGLGPRSAPAIEEGDSGTGLINADDLRRLATSGDPDDLKRLVRLTTGGDQ
jgi:hypothetical protein